ncbi:MAG TPA: type II 3-dehydroquinate dehydratase, partial [Myxococcaceae bacterium]|nr:type II 3-dehydroquinate dehydratase [Myxococcaceae bacterium]
MKILVLHGPNVNLLGHGAGDNPNWSLEAVNHAIEEQAASLGLELKILQSNHEGVLIDTLHAERLWADAVVLNPAALAHTSYALRDAIAAVAKPTIEVHMTDIRRREPWRRRSVLKDVCAARVIGKGIDSYLIALRSLAGAKPTQMPRKAASRPALAARHTKLGTGDAVASSSRKTIGRRAGSPTPSANSLSPSRIAPAAKSPGAEFLSRALVRQKIADRLGGKLTASGLATWARRHWLEVQRGAPAESGYRELLEDCLQ